MILNLNTLIGREKRSREFAKLDTYARLIHKRYTNRQLLALQDTMNEKPTHFRFMRCGCGTYFSRQPDYCKECVSSALRLCHKETPNDS